MKSEQCMREVIMFATDWANGVTVIRRDLSLFLPPPPSHRESFLSRLGFSLSWPCLCPADRQALHSHLHINITLVLSQGEREEEMTGGADGCLGVCWLTQRDAVCCLLSSPCWITWLPTPPTSLSVSHLTTTECHLNNQLIHSLSGHSTEKSYQ